MKAVIGLGNPGSRYRKTRHNVGFMVLDELASRYRLKFKAGKGEYMIAFSKNHDAAFVKPLIYMNDSGVAVKDVLKRYDIHMEDTLVVYDDLDLELGRIKFKLSGSGGSHNGMKSIIYHLDSDTFPRLKIGIDIDRRRETWSSVDYVLSNFSRSERTKVDEIIPLAADAIDHFVIHDLEQTMNVYNQRQFEQE